MIPADYPDSLREIPWSREAEYAILGGLMLDPEALIRIADKGLEAGHFFSSENAAIFSAAVRLLSANKPADLLAVHEELQGDKVGCGVTLKDLNAICNSVPSAANIRQYADIVLEKALRRAVVAAADKAAALAYEPGDAAEKLDKAIGLFTAIKQTSVRSEPKQLKDLMPSRIDHWEAMARGDETPGMSTGLANFDHILGGGLKPGKVYIFAARPSVGKSSLAQQIGVNAAAMAFKTLLLSQEMPSGEVIDRAVANLGRVYLEKLNTGDLQDDDWGRVSDALEISKNLAFWVDDQPALTLLDMRSKAHMVKHKHGLDVLIVDYVQLCASSLSADKRHHQIEEISRGLKRLAKELNVAVILISQLNRNADEREPRLSDLKESGSIEEDADVVIFLHPKGKLDHETWLMAAIFAKNRQGMRGRVALEFRGNTQRWNPSDADVSPKQKS